jgi:hypothetical protein
MPARAVDDRLTVWVPASAKRWPRPAHHGWRLLEKYGTYRLMALSNGKVYCRGTGSLYTLLRLGRGRRKGHCWIEHNFAPASPFTAIQRDKTYVRPPASAGR